MNNPNPDTPPEDTSTETEAAPAAQPQFDPRRRLRELLSVPERDRSDEVWDEIIELEIQLAPGNRISAGNNNDALNPGGRMPQQGKPGGGQSQKKHRQQRPGGNNRRPRQNKPQSGGGGTPSAS